MKLFRSPLQLAVAALAVAFVVAPLAYVYPLGGAQNSVIAAAPDADENGPDPIPNVESTPEPTPTATPTATPRATPKPEPTPTAGPTPTPTPDGGRVTSFLSPEVFTPGVDDVTLDGVLSGATAAGSDAAMGGQKSLGLAVFVGKKGRIRPDVNWVRVRVQEEDDSSTDPTKPIQHSFKENHVDYTFDLNSSGWRKQKCVLPEGGPAQKVEGEGETSGSPKEEGPDGKDQTWMFCTRAQPVASSGTSRYSNVAWNTSAPQSNDPDGAGNAPQTTLQGHNGQHNVRIVAWGGTNANGNWSVSADSGQGLGSFPFEQQELGGTNWEPQAFSSPPPTIKRTVSNLVIKEVSTSNGTQDYFKFDADSDDSSLTNPTITFEIEDKGDKHRYQWWLWAKPTRDEPNSVAFTGIMPSDGYQTVVVNAANPQGYTQDHPLTEWGTYTFDLRIKEVKQNSEEGIGEPLVDLRSQKLSFAQHSIDFAVDGVEGSETVKARISYQMQDQAEVDGTEAKVDFLNPNFVIRESKTVSAQHQVVYENVDLHTFDASDFSVDSSGNRWIVVFGAEDGHADDYRDHQNKRVAVVNKGEPKYFHIEEDWMKLSGKTYHSLASYPILSKVYARAGWIVQSSGVTGEHDTLTIGDGNQWVEPQHYNTRTFNSRESFTHFSVRHQKRYIHSIGAPFAENSDLYGISNSEQRWAYTFVGTIENVTNSSSGQDLDNAVVKTTIHEVGHQFGLSHHAQSDYDSNLNMTSNGKLCVMDTGIPGPVTDFWFCPRHSGLLSTSSFPSTSPINPPSQ